MTLRLSVLDQSPIQKGGTAEQAISETVELAKLTDKLGYTRFWVSEHHNTRSLAGSTPEVLIAHLAGQTQHIRVGSGGIMLPNHSALKVAENFRMLETIFPGRIDLGMGRAPGTDRITASILNPSNNFSEQDFIEQLSDLQHYLHDTAEAGTYLANIHVTPNSQSSPEQWILSSSGQSAVFAAHFGLGFSFAHFINPIGGPQAVELYKQRFSANGNNAKPEANAAFFAFCSEDEEKVRQQIEVMDYRFIQLETKGKFDPVSYDDVKNAVYTPFEQERIQFNRQRLICGTPDQLKIRLEQLAKDYKVNELILANITLDFKDRLRSYELLAEVFELKQH
ncbi:LLM class flavin-dependent oxidoreductase [Solitalea canadensis]|uniref:Luciferase-like monooxygenase n=1 Tax=Solitalea canadensis (strain ATCC 29591 / DSM 3403 / JCM 21819 / LMG 8368 / NBRC 15130 / NCIMB 12057 / USAM 9D) TaxID=929556 RepID=H8KS29_SOLCM|nr:LLM class flavin-dependent oxidoreductase [Solitalea canadensis]AFD07817.1 luciferase family oxidoreductase, group 1 [Solitalea canadensis DSM 3403]